MLSPRAKPVESGGSQGRVPQLSPLLSMACHRCWCLVTERVTKQVGM